MKGEIFVKHSLSFDIAKGKSVYCFIDELRNTIIGATLIEHKKDEFDSLYKVIKKYDNLIVIMESTSIYHLPVENYFRYKSVKTIVINPKLVKQFKDTLNKSKTDKLDCFKIARSYLGTIENFYYKNDEYFIYNPLARQYRSLIEGQTRLKNRYKQLIEIVFPEFSLIKSEINKIKNQLINETKDKKLFKIINSIPGFGEFSTALFLAEVGDITRFDDKYQFISFIGIDSVTSQSGISAYHGQFPKLVVNLAELFYLML
jgi:transposase